MVVVAVACLLLITFANVANLLLARAQERRKELSIRAALGANRGRLMVQLLLEGSMLALSGGAIGLLIGSWTLDTIKALAPQDISRFEEVNLAADALLFVGNVTLVTAPLS